MKGFNMIYEVRSSILGFENIKEVRLEKIDSLFYRMFDVENEGTVFTLINPFALAPNYDFDLSDSFAETMEMDSCEEFKVFNLVIIDSEVGSSKINFLAPIIVNEDAKAIGQIVLQPANQSHVDNGIKAINTFVS
jgi:flagellar assembly factor FliW